MLNRAQITGLCVTGVFCALLLVGGQNCTQRQGSGLLSPGDPALGETDYKGAIKASHGSCNGCYLISKTPSTDYLGFDNINSQMVISVEVRLDGDYAYVILSDGQPEPLVYTFAYREASFTNNSYDWVFDDNMGYIAFREVNISASSDGEISHGNLIYGSSGGGTSGTLGSFSIHRCKLHGSCL